MQSRKILGIELRVVTPLAALAGAMTMLQIGEYLLSEFLLLFSTSSFVYQIWRELKKPLPRVAWTILAVAGNIYFMAVVYSYVGDSGWSRLSRTKATFTTETP